MFLLMARTRLRLGEALAVQWADFDLDGRTLHVTRNLSAGRVDTPKTHAARDVDLSNQLGDRLTKLRVTRATEALRLGWGQLPSWVFCTPTDSPFHPRVVQRAFGAVLRKTGLPEHFTPHGLRHTFASLLLSDGVSPAYVQRMLGHSSIKLTVDLYGKWLPVANKGAVDRLDGPGSTQVVADVVANERKAGAGAPVTRRFSRTSGERRPGQPPKSFFNDSRKPPTRGPCSPPLEERSSSSSSSLCRAVSLVGTSMTTP